MHAKINSLQHGVIWFAKVHQKTKHNAKYFDEEFLNATVGIIHTNYAVML